MNSMLEILMGMIKHKLGYLIEKMYKEKNAQRGLVFVDFEKTYCNESRKM